MYKITQIEKSLFIENQRPYGSIIVYFGSKNSFKNTGRMSITKFMALSHILENDSVAYDPSNNLFITPVDKSKLIPPPNGTIV